MTDVAEEKKTDNWAEMSDGEDAEQEEEKVAPAEPKKNIPVPKKGTKNKGGDYVVTKIDIPDFRDGIKKGTSK